jgi:sugar diacid utilization regulator
VLFFQFKLAAGIDTLAAQLRHTSKALRKWSKWSRPEREIRTATSTPRRRIRSASATTPGNNHGPSGWAQTVDEACKALDFGAPAPGKKSVHLYSDIVVNDSVRRTNNVLRYLHCLLERLAEEPELLSTLQTYFDQLQRRKITADALGIHPNTLNHRLERIETLLGAKLDEPSWIAKLHVAVRLRQQTLPEPE